MKLFLTSYAYKTLDRVLDILPDSPTNLTVAFIATAADPYDDKDFVKVDRDKLVQMGFKIVDVDIKNKSESDLNELLKCVDVIFVAGGNTYYLLYHAQKSGFLNITKQLINNGIIYIGSSAGSVLACPTIDAARLFDPPSIVPELTNYQGMGLVDFIILPHFDKPRYLERLRKTIEEWSMKKYHLIPLTDEQAIIINDNQFTFVDSSI